MSESVTNKVLSGELPASKINRFMLVRSFAGYTDTVLQANEANKLTSTSDENVFHFLHSFIQPKRKRYGKWVKQNTPVDEEELSKYIKKYECSRATAIEAMAFDKRISGNN